MASQRFLDWCDRKDEQEVNYSINKAEENAREIEHVYWETLGEDAE